MKSALKTPGQQACQQAVRQRSVGQPERPAAQT